MDEPRRPEWLRSAKGTAFTGIGSLEAEILTIVWRRDSTTVRDVYEELRERRQIAYTTVMTVMNNLVKKKLLEQDRSATAYVYRPAVSGESVALTILDSVVEKLMSGDRGMAVAHLLGLDKPLSDEQFNELAAYAAKA